MGDRITVPNEGEEPRAEWICDRVKVTHLPDDPQGILRISLGYAAGGPDDEPDTYCVFRGDQAACIDLLQRAVDAMEGGP